MSQIENGEEYSKKMVKNIPGLDVSNIGLGSIYTLHGMPDLRLPGLYRL